jgi:hypothetical protein
MELPNWLGYLAIFALFVNAIALVVQTNDLEASRRDFKELSFNLSLVKAGFTKAFDDAYFSDYHLVKLSKTQPCLNNSGYLDINTQVLLENVTPVTWNTTKVRIYWNNSEGFPMQYIDEAICQKVLLGKWNGFKCVGYAVCGQGAEHLNQTEQQTLETANQIARGR